jgi:hypothetical protein
MLCVSVASVLRFQLGRPRLLDVKTLISSKTSRLNKSHGRSSQRRPAFPLSLLAVMTTVTLLPTPPLRFALIYNIPYSILARPDTALPTVKINGRVHLNYKRGLKHSGDLLNPRPWTKGRTRIPEV